MSNWEPTNWIAGYQDASEFKTRPKPLTDFNFSGLTHTQNSEFKLWLGMIGEDEVAIAEDQSLEIHFVQAFKEQLTQPWNHNQRNPAKEAGFAYFRGLSNIVEKMYSPLNGGLAWWQMVQYVPTQAELTEAFKTPVEVIKAKPVKMTEIKKQPKLKKQKSANPSTRDIWTLDLFGEVA